MSLPNVFSGRLPLQASTGLSRMRPRAIYLALVSFAALLGLALRLRGADGDLWLDEIWSLVLIERAKSIGDIFIGVHHDNNHFLNSAWLWLVGPDASALTMRLPAVVFGVLSIPAAAALGRRSSQAAGVFAALLISVSYFFVHYGSEARGYSGMILAILLAYNALESVLEDRNKRGNYIVFGLAIAFGTFSHLTMVEATGALCLAALARSVGPETRLTDWLRSAAPILIVAGVATAPAVACFIVGALSPDFHVGQQEPFTLTLLAQGLADMARATVGFPREISDIPVLISAAVLTLASLALAPARCHWFPALAIFGLPLLHASLGLPNQFYARFHLTAAVALIILLSDSLAVVWSKRALRAIAMLGLVLFAAAQSFELSQFFAFERGAYKEAIRAMSKQGSITYSVDTGTGIKSVISYHAAGLGLEAKAISDETWCESAPNWLIVFNVPNSTPLLPERKTAGPANCQAIFLRDRTFEAWGLSGFDWTLYRRAALSPSR